MHAEFGVITEETAAALNEARAKGGRIVASARPRCAFSKSATTEEGIVQPFAGDTSIFITPGYRFQRG